ncbi:MAG TPA: hypothetical protein VFL63_05615 [Rhodanobacteraceae bacterium]|nr:hypothetical protein [Rhodanobacteraceae bacterium]
MKLLHSHAAIASRLPRFVATGAFARVDGSRRPNPMGAYRPFTRITFIA